MDIFLVDSLKTPYEISFALQPEISNRKRRHFTQPRCQRHWWQELETKVTRFQNLIILPTFSFISCFLHFMSNIMSKFPTLQVFTGKRYLFIVLYEE
jgi:hypothetical protein